jgi:flagellar hook protein FlgE
MNSTSSIALSGMQTAQLLLDTSANNVANVSTPGYKRQEVVQSVQPQGGVTGTVRRSETEGPSLEADVISQLVAKNAFLANLSVFKTSDKMAGALLSLRA